MEREKSIQKRIEIHNKRLQNKLQKQEEIKEKKQNEIKKSILGKLEEMGRKRSNDREIREIINVI